jgi:hypothetical protein
MFKNAAIGQKFLKELRACGGVQVTRRRGDYVLANVGVVCRVMS